MKLTFPLLVLLLFLSNCSENTNNDIAHVDVSLYESYNLKDIFSTLDSANKIIRRKELDSIANNKTGIAILDKLNEEKAENGSEIDGFTENNPLFSVICINRNRDGEINSSAMLGITNEGNKFLERISKVDTLFKNDLEWRIIKRSNKGYSAIHGIKKEKEKISVRISDIDSVIVEPRGLSSFGGVAQKISDLKGWSVYWVEFKLKNEFKNELGIKTYSMIIKLNAKEYIGSVTENEKYVRIGEIDSEKLEGIESVFGNRIRIRNNEMF